MDTLVYTYGYSDFDRENPSIESIQEVVFDLDESTWADDLLMYREDGIPFMTVPEMRNVFIEDILCKVTQPDIAKKITSFLWGEWLTSLDKNTLFLNTCLSRPHVFSCHVEKNECAPVVLSQLSQEIWFSFRTHLCVDRSSWYTTWHHVPSRVSHTRESRVGENVSDDSKDSHDSTPAQDYSVLNKNTRVPKTCLRRSYVKGTLLIKRNSH